MKEGYILVDCGELELNDNTTQSITGLYKRAKEAMATGKAILACNCLMNGSHCTPVSVVAWQENATIIATGHVLRIAIESDDDVTVTNLVAG